MSRTRRAIKARSHESVRMTVPKAAFVTLVFLAITYALSALDVKISNTDEYVRNMQAALNSGNIVTMRAARANQSAAAGIFSILISIMSSMLEIGYIIYALNVSRRVKADVGNLFDAFGIFFRFLWLNILTGIRILLWSLLFLIPGIIAAYRYRQAVYIMIDNPDYTAGQCLRMSSRMMRGHKWELFVLDFSLIGWGLLACIPIVNLWVYPYLKVVHAGYYDEISGARLHSNGAGGLDPFGGPDSM